jgi:hypothetical protein
MDDDDRSLQARVIHVWSLTWVGLSLFIMTFSRTMIGLFHFTNLKSRIVRRGQVDSFIQILYIIGFQMKKQEVFT